MSIIGFNFTKINVEKKGPATGKVNIANNVGIKDVNNAKINLGGAENAGLKFSFGFTSKYEPTVGIIELEGEVVAIEDKKVVDQVLAEWKEKKSVPQKIMEQVLNHILNKCNVQALILSRDINLPSPIQLPKVNVQSKKKE